MLKYITEFEGTNEFPLLSIQVVSNKVSTRYNKKIEIFVGTSTIRPSTNNYDRDDATSTNLKFHASEEYNNFINSKCHALHGWCLSNPRSFSESIKRTLKELKNINSSKRDNFTKDRNCK